MSQTKPTPEDTPVQPMSQSPDLTKVTPLLSQEKRHSDLPEATADPQEDTKVETVVQPEQVLSGSKMDVHSIEKDLSTKQELPESLKKELVQMQKSPINITKRSTSALKSQVYKKCAICNEVYGDKKSVALACLHKYHEECVVKKGKQVVCPLCNATGKHIATPNESALKINK